MIKDRAFTTCDQSPRAVHNMDCWTLYIEAKSDVQPVAIVQWEHLSSGRDRSCLNTYLRSNTKCSWPQQAAIAASTATPANTWKERAHKTRALLKSASSWLNVRQRASRLQVSAFTATGASLCSHPANPGPTTDELPTQRLGTTCGGFFLERHGPWAGELASMAPASLRRPCLPQR